MDLFRIAGSSNQLAVELFKFLGPVAEGNDFCGADKCEVLQAN